MSDPIFRSKGWVNRAPALLTIWPGRLEWTPRTVRLSLRQAAPVEPGGFPVAQVRNVLAKRFSLASSQVTVMLEGLPVVRFEAPHVDTDVIRQVLLELAGLPYDPDKRLLPLEQDRPGWPG